MNKLKFSLSSIVLLAVLVSSCEKRGDKASKSQDLKQPKVLILYSSGDPNAVVPMPNATIDAVTSPTPKVVNTEFVAKSIAEALKSSNIAVVLRRTEDFKDPRELLAADVTLIGSSTHFWNMSWQTKKLFDEVLYPIYVHRKQKLKDKIVACFTTSEIRPSGQQCIKSMNKALSDFGARILPGLVVTDNTPPDKVKRTAIHFARNILNSFGRKRSH